MHFHFSTIALPETLNSGEKTRVLWLVNGDCDKNNIQSQKKQNKADWLLLVFANFTENQITWFRDLENALNHGISRDFHGFTDMNHVKSWKMAQNFRDPGISWSRCKHYLQPLTLVFYTL